MLRGSDSYHDICKKSDELEQEGVPCILSGNYADIVGPGLVYEMEAAKSVDFFRKDLTTMRKSDTLNRIALHRME